MTDVPVLSQPHVRRDLQAHLAELRADDPRPAWQAQRERGMASGVDQVFHFFFDDHDFDEAAVGVTLFDELELQSIGALKKALEAVLDVVGDAGDDDFVLNPLWRRVTQAAVATDRGLAQ